MACSHAPAKKLTCCLCPSRAKPFGTLVSRMHGKEYCFRAWHAVLGLCSQQLAPAVAGNQAKPQSSQPPMHTGCCCCVQQSLLHNTMRQHHNTTPKSHNQERSTAPQCLTAMSRTVASQHPCCVSTQQIYPKLLITRNPCLLKTRPPPNSMSCNSTCPHT